MNHLKEIVPIYEVLILILVSFVFLPLVVYAVLASTIDYQLLKRRYFKKHKWGLNISCGGIDGCGINADIAERNAPNFVLIKNIYKLPFKTKQFKNVICSHTMEHVEDPEKFYKELKRVSRNVHILIPPLWDIVALAFFREHKWQFLTLKTSHKNGLPRKFKLPWWGYQKKFGQ